MIPVSEMLGGICAVVNRAELPEVQDRRTALDWISRARESILGSASTHGAVLLRGFPLPDEDAFALFTKALGQELQRYIEGNSPRTALSPGIYTSTEFPSSYRITLHNELSYAHWWPRYLYFYSHTAPVDRGETLLAPSTTPLGVLDSSTVARFRDLGVTYVQNLHGGRGPGRSWQATFETSERHVVAEYLTRGGVEHQWKPDGGLRTSQRRPALRVHPETGAEVWFNQVDQWHVSNLDDETRDAFQMLYGAEDLPLNAYFGDGQPLDEAELAAVREGYFDVATPVAWQQHDLLVVDNVLLAHGRAPFTGPRRILVSMS